MLPKMERPRESLCRSTYPLGAIRSSRDSGPKAGLLGDFRSRLSVTPVRFEVAPDPVKRKVGEPKDDVKLNEGFLFAS